MLNIIYIYATATLKKITNQGHILWTLFRVKINHLYESETVNIFRCATNGDN